MSKQLILTAQAQEKLRREWDVWVGIPKFAKQGRGGGMLYEERSA